MSTVTILVLALAPGCERGTEGGEAESGSATVTTNSGFRKPHETAVTSRSAANVEPLARDASVEPPTVLMARAIQDLEHKTALHDRLFQIGTAAWALDQTTGIITFTGPKVVATARAQIIGTFDKDDRTWLWAWDNPSIEAPLRTDSQLARTYGQKHSISELTRRKFKTTEERAWELTALACRLAGCEGAYKAPAGETEVFVTFAEVRLQKPGGQEPQ